MIFDPVTYDDAGIYRCTATAGQESVNVTIEVTVGGERLEGNSLWSDMKTIEFINHLNSERLFERGMVNQLTNAAFAVAPRFISPPNDTEIMEGHPVWLDCIVEGDPFPQVRWDRNSNFNVLSHERPRIQMLENGELQLQYYNKKKRW